MTKVNESPAVILTIAGFDPSGGAGIIVDISTIVSFGCRPAAAITSLTFQNSEGVFGATHETASSLRAQVLPIVQENRIAAVKIGMLPNVEIVEEVARLIREANLPAPVIDPVLRSSSGYQLMEEEAIEVLVSELLPLARLLTPNIPEAEQLTGLTITNEGEMHAAAARLREMGASAVLVKGGHLPSTQVRSRESEEMQRNMIDVLENDGQFTVFRGEWIDAPRVRGTGCRLSSAVAACLGQEIELEESVRLARQFVVGAIRHAPKLRSDPVTLALTEFTSLE